MTVKAYIPNSTSDNVSVIDTSSNTVMATITVGNEPIGVAVSPDGSKVCIANHDLGSAPTISIINAITNTISATITGTGFVVAFTPDGNKIVSADQVSGQGRIKIFDLTTSPPTNLATLTFGSQPNQGGLTITPDGSKGIGWWWKQRYIFR